MVGLVKRETERESVVSGMLKLPYYNIYVRKAVPNTNSVLLHYKSCFTYTNKIQGLQEPITEKIGEPMDSSGM